MVKVDDSWQCPVPSDWNSPNINYVGSRLPSSQQSFAPSCLNPSKFSENVAFPGIPVSALHRSYGVSCGLPPLMESSLSPPDPYLKEPQFAFPHKLGVETVPNNMTSTNQKSYVIFDQSDHHIRFFLSPFGSSRELMNVPLKPLQVCHSHDMGKVPITEQILPTNLKSHGFGENQLEGEESEFHEDSEEINALLYSDDDEYDYDDGEEDMDGEVTSTDHSPCEIKENPDNHDQVGGIIEEVATSNGSTKRQRLLDGGYKKSLVVEHANVGGNDRSGEYTNDVESSCAYATAKGDAISPNLCTKNSRKDKIHETLTILENIIPGLKSKEPTLIIDEAINYLKSLKLKAKALGLANL